jgi:hypothetical protein
MKTVCKTVGAQTAFILAEVPAACQDAVRQLHYDPVEEGFAKTYPADTPGLERLYRSFERDAEAMVLQAARVHPALWALALQAFIERIANERLHWWLTGSAALAVRGIDAAPRDLDLVVDEEDAQRLGEMLGDHLIEPVLPVRGWVSRWWGRAFWHARLEWIAGVDPAVDDPDVTDFGPTAASRLETVNWHGQAIRVPPLELQLQTSERRGLAERVKMIGHAL